MLVRSLLAVSLSGFMFSTVFAESNSAQQLAQLPDTRAIPIETVPLSQPRTVVTTENNVDVEDAPTTTNTAPTQHANNQPLASTEQPTSPPVKVEWTLNALNKAEWSEGLERGQLPIYAKAQVLLNRRYASPGAIDGSTGMNTLKAISAYQIMHKLPGAGVLTKETWDSLNAQSTEPVFIEYTITAQDIQGPYAKSIPSSAAERAKLKGLYYTRVTEMLGEKFHMDETFLKKLNPNASFNKAGEKIIVANVTNTLPEDIHLIIAHKSAKQLYLFNSKNQMIAAFPATVGKEGTPSPTGDLKIANVAPNPWYSYNPKTFGQAAGQTYSIAPGPNNYVGNMWIGLSRPSFGIHGTPEPSNISKGSGSNGCVRLTNWDANNLSKRVKVGISVKFLE